jgi:hypothetical protein
MNNTPILATTPALQVVLIVAVLLIAIAVLLAIHSAIKAMDQSEQIRRDYEEDVMDNGTEEGPDDKR